MEMFPRYQLRLRYEGENRVYQLLSAMELAGGFAIHSLNLPEHAYKRWAEADFVVVSPHGVTLLEVKGGQVGLVGKEWRYQNARGQSIISHEGPARQAMTAAIELEKLLTNRVGKKVRCRWGVVFPLCHFNKQLAELPPTRLATNLQCQDLDTFRVWLSSIPSDQHDPAEFALKPAEVDAIKEILLPELSATTSLGLAVRANENEIIRLTRQQFDILNAVGDNSRLAVSGGAGTGKTELACLIARVEKTAGRRPAIVTSQPSLLLALKERMAEFQVPVVSSTLPADTDTLIVDEGQDLTQPDLLADLFDQLPGGLTSGRWRWFMDPNLQYLETPPDPSCLAELRRHSMSVALSRNVRSTREIVDAIRTLLDADVGTSEIDGFGIKVDLSPMRDGISEADAAAEILQSALEDGVSPADIAVLGAVGTNGPVCGEILRRFRGQLRPLSDGGRIQSRVHGVAASIQAFRGLEARVVLLTDLARLPAGRLGDSLLYTGMSRASAALTLLITPPFHQRLTSLFRQSLHSPNF
jgi:hypothetical protein